MEKADEILLNKILTGKIIIYFYTPWAYPCEKLLPFFISLAKKYTTLSFIKINPDDHFELAGSLGIRGIPTALFFKDGKELYRITGSAMTEKLEAKIIEHYLNSKD